MLTTTVASKQRVLGDAHPDALATARWLEYVQSKLPAENPAKKAKTRFGAELDRTRIVHLDDGDDDYARGLDGPWHFDVAPTGALSSESLRVAIRLAQEGRNVGPVGQWDVSRVTDFERLFRDWPDFNEPIGSWDVSSATTMRGMFMGCHAFNQNIADWDVSGVRDMSHMFHGAHSFDSHIGRWDVSSVTTMRGMFWHGRAFNSPIGSWDVRRVRDMTRMFCGASSFNQALQAWDVRNVERFDAMFKSCTALNVEFAWSAPAAVSMEEMFHGATAMNRSVVLRDTSELISTARMFRRAPRFNSRLDMTNTSNVTDMSEMFAGASALRRTVRLDMTRVMVAHDMFDQCPDEAMVRASLDAHAVPALRRQLGTRLFARAKR
jgi:surface protein